MKLPRSTWGRLGLMVLLFAAMIVLLIWRGPEWNLVGDAFRLVDWKWVVAAIALNLLSVVARAGAWHRVIESAMPPPTPRFRLVFSAPHVPRRACPLVVATARRVHAHGRKSPARQEGSYFQGIAR